MFGVVFWLRKIATYASPGIPDLRRAVRRFATYAKMFEARAMKALPAGELLEGDVDAFGGHFLTFIFRGFDAGFPAEFFLSWVHVDPRPTRA